MRRNLKKVVSLEIPLVDAAKLWTVLRIYQEEHGIRPSLFGVVTELEAILARNGLDVPDLERPVASPRKGAKTAVRAGEVIPCQN